jgi:crooked neck
MDTIRASQMTTARSVKVKNRAAAPIQITAEQIIVEARDRSEAQQPPPPRRHITDPQELAEYRMRTRKEFEDKLRMQRQHIGVWLNYAKWEFGQGEIDRARSVFERAIEVDYKNTMVWIR